MFAIGMVDVIADKRHKQVPFLLDNTLSQNYHSFAIFWLQQRWIHQALESIYSQFQDNDVRLIFAKCVL